MKYEIYQDKRDEWRWRLKHANGNILAIASEGYVDRFDCCTCLDSVRFGSRTAPVIEV